MGSSLINSAQRLCSTAQLILDLEKIGIDASKRDEMTVAIEHAHALIYKCWTETVHPEGVPTTSG